MIYTHITTDELVLIEACYHQNVPVSKIATYLKRSQTPIYTVIHFLKQGHIALEYYQQYKRNKRRWGRGQIVLSKEQLEYIKEKVAQRAGHLDGISLAAMIVRLAVQCAPSIASSRKKPLMKSHFL